MRSSQLFLNILLQIRRCLERYREIALACFIDVTTIEGSE